MGFRVVEAGEEHGEAILRLAREDPILNALVLYDWLVLRREKPEACDFFVALGKRSGRVEAACVAYHDRGFDSIVFCGRPEASRAIIEALAPQKALLPRVPPEELPGILEALGGRVTKIYDVFLMACGPGSFRPAIRHPVVRLGPEHAELFWRFLREELRREASLEDARKRLTEPDKPVFAILHGQRIASLALIYVSLPEVSMVGGVYTVPDMRGRGLATSVTSAATRAALELSEAAALIVRTDNEPALRVYRRIGYEVYRRLKWICVGVDVRP